jgi:hypothetical protein
VVRKQLKVQLLLLIAAISLASAYREIANASIPVSRSLVEGLKIAKSSASVTIISQRQQKRQSVWERLVSIFRRKKEDGSTQGEFCSISPNLSAYITWSDRPLFVWQGTIKEIQVRLPGNESALWTYKVTGNEESILYNQDNNGKALEPGQEYEYQVEYETIDNKGEKTTSTKTIPFKIMEAEERQQIVAELAALENRHHTMSAEELALERVLYFGEKPNLFLDVVRELFSVSSPSSDWITKTKKLRTEFCE